MKAKEPWTEVPEVWGSLVDQARWMKEHGETWVDFAFPIDDVLEADTIFRTAIGIASCWWQLASRYQDVYNIWPELDMYEQDDGTNDDTG